MTGSDGQSQIFKASSVPPIKEAPLNPMNDTSTHVMGHNKTYIFEQWDTHPDHNSVVPGGKDRAD